MTKGKPRGFWENKGNRIKETNRFIEKVENEGKNVEEISIKDFKKNCLYGLLANYYNSSPYLAFKEAGYDIKQSEMKHPPKGEYRNLTKEDGLEYGMERGYDKIGRFELNFREGGYYKKGREEGWLDELIPSRINYLKMALEEYVK